MNQPRRHHFVPRFYLEGFCAVDARGLAVFLILTVLPEIEDARHQPSAKVEIRMEVRNEVFISVDVETSGPIPGEYSMLSIGACMVDKPETSFERTLKPLNRNADPEALAVTGFSLDELEQNGAEPRQAMAEFDAWVKAACGQGDVPVFVGLNAPFDWSFVN